MKNNKGFTMVEMILVVVLIAIVTLIALPNIFEATNESKKEKFKNYEDNLFKALELYNTDKQEDIWKVESSNETYNATLSEIQKSNPNLEVEDCTINMLQIYKQATKIKDATADEGAKYQNSYIYKVCITCGEVYKSSNSYCG